MLLGGQPRPRPKGAEPKHSQFWGFPLSTTTLFEEQPNWAW